MTNRKFLAISVFLLSQAAFAPAYAMDAFEIQVYDSGINKPGEKSFELHTNYVAQGRTDGDYPAQIPSDKMAHFTGEFAYGLAPEWELGAYLQSAVGGGSYRYAGAKGRVKYIHSKEASAPFFYGANFELSTVPEAFEQSNWSIELRPIFGVELSRWTFTVNPILGWALSTDPRVVPELNPAMKAAYNTGLGFSTGLEYYSTLGPADGVSNLQAQEHALFLVGDLENGPIELNVGVGRGLTDAANPWTVKAIIGNSF